MIHLSKGDTIYIKTQEQLLHQYFGTLLKNGSFQPYNSTHYPNVVTSRMYGMPVRIECDHEIDETESSDYILTVGYYSIHTWMVDWNKTIYNLGGMEIE